MITLEEYKKLAPTERLSIFMESLSMTNRTPEYYVNWNKVYRETRKYEVELNTLNYLIGKENIFDEAYALFSKQPDLLCAIPSLIACRETKLDILSVDEKDNMSFYSLDFARIDKSKILEYTNFVQQTGLLNFLKEKANRSLVDYVYGVEAGLDSNARKNRSGTTMENIVERNVEKVCREYGLEYMAQASATYIKNRWDITVPVDKSERRFDVAIYNPNTNRLWLIETNYYGGGGSKLKAVAGEFTELNAFVRDTPDSVEFVWVTDGQGWHTAHRPLAEAFGHIDYVFNLEMLRTEYFRDLFLY